jgi:hypothetical protein
MSNPASEPTNKNRTEARIAADVKNLLSPAQVAFAELLGTLLAAKWRLEHQQNRQPLRANSPVSEGCD